MGSLIVVFISIHAPHARSDRESKTCSPSRKDFNPRSSCEERPLLIAELPENGYFNPRSSCEERPVPCRIVCLINQFQSTLLMRGATIYAKHCRKLHCISIHAPHARSDILAESNRGQYPKFQSTLLMRGATVSILGIDLPDFIIYFSRTYPFSPKMPTSRHLSCKLHFLCDGTSHFGDL